MNPLQRWKATSHSQLQTRYTAFKIGGTKYDGVRFPEIIRGINTKEGESEEEAYTSIDLG